MLQSYIRRENFEAKLLLASRALKHWTIAESAGHYNAMHQLLVALKKSMVGTDAIDATLTAYKNSCAEMRSKARDAFIRFKTE